MAIKRTASEMEDVGLGKGEEDEDDEEGEDEREDDDEHQHHQPQQQQQAQPQEEDEDLDNDEQDADEHAGKKAKAPKPKKGALKKKAFGSDDDDEQENKIAREPANRTKINDDDDEEEENPDIELGKSQTVDPEKMQAILAQFTPEQMSRYECYRRSGFQKANMRRLLQSVAGCPISMPMTIVMSGIAKMFVGELVEIGRIVMTERKETGPIRPCHIREAYRRLKLKGKVPARTRPRLFH